MQFSPNYEKPHRSGLFKRLPTPIWLSTLVAVITTSIASLIYVGTANAGIFSFLSPIFEESKAAIRSENSTKAPNLQNLALLQAASNIDPNPHKAGDAIPIANGDVLVAEIAQADIAEQTYSTEISVYTVRSGDTVSGVAKMFNVSINTVLWANNLTSKSILKPGDTLVILPVSGISHTVKKGDTISTIAKEYHADVDEILAYNDIKLSSPLSVGSSIIIPNAEAGSPTTKTTSKTSSASSASYPSYNGYYLRPISSGVKSQGLHGHNGVDLAAPVGTPVIAAAAGTVIISKSGGWNGGYGNYIVIAHNNGTQTLYSHMSRNTVSSGETVSQGEIIGYIGLTGKTTGPHLHFEVRGAKNPF